ncbi:MAG: serine/threonine protein kinase [Flavipsychrobacter sp.]|jgi:hypothetical protein|nr:serine/threonine protein kinase [Flavipsychrobacter sp.]
MKVSVRIGIIFIALLACSNNCLHAQIITTYAGGDSLLLGDGGPATAANIGGPNAAIFDAAGDLLIADWGNNRVRKVNAAGIITTVAGFDSYGFSGDGGPATAAQTRIPSDVKADGMGNFYFLDGFNYRIRKVDAAGIITTVAGNGVNGETGDGGPATAAAVATHRFEVDRVGNIYVGYAGHIRKVDAATGIINTIIGGSTMGYSGDGGPASAALFTVRGIMVDGIGNMYIGGDAVVRKVDTAGIVHTVAGNGIASFSGDGGPATAARLGITIKSVWVDEAENLYIADVNNARIRKVNALGIITTIAGINPITGYSGDGGPATAADLGQITSVTKKEGGGNIFLSVFNNRVRMITDTNHAALLTGSHAVQLNLCVATSDTSFTPVDTIDLNALLTATDIDIGQVNKWQLIYGPFHGSVSGSYVTYTTGSSLTPAGFTYTAGSGYVGFDTFKIRVTDGYTADTVTFYVRIDDTFPDAGTITGPDTVYVGGNITLTSSSTGGVFSEAGIYTTVSGNIVTGVLPGADTIFYIVSNACGNDTAIHTLLVKAYPDGAGNINDERFVLLWPNPVSDEFIIAADVAAYTSCSITNTLGQLLVHLPLGRSETKVNVAMLPPGLYYITLTGVNDIVVKKFVRQ